MCSYKSTNVEDFCHRAYAENPLRYLVVDLFSYKKEQLDGNAVISKELWEAVKKNNNLFVPMRTYRHWNWQKQRKRKQRKQRRQRKQENIKDMKKNNWRLVQNWSPFLFLYPNGKERTSAQQLNHNHHPSKNSIFSKFRN